MHLIKNLVILQIPSVEFHVTNFFKNHLFHLVTVLLVFVSARLYRLVSADQPFLGITHRLDGLLLALVADLPWLLLTVLGVAVLLSLLRASLHLQLTDLLGLKVAVLLLDGKGEDVGELLTVPVYVSLAHLDLDLSWDVVATLSRFSAADYTLGSISIVLG